MLRGSLKLIREIRKSPSIPQEGTQHPQWEDMVENKGRNGEEGQQLQGKEERNTGDQEEDIKDNKNQEEYKVNVENQKENELNFKKIDRISEEQARGGELETDSLPPGTMDSLVPASCARDKE